jgi:hypothetical protein
MSQTLEQIYVANPSTTMAADNLLYLSVSPYTTGNDSAIKWSDLVTSIVAEGAGGSTNEVQYNNAGALDGLTASVNGLLVTSAAGVPSIGNTIGAAISVSGNISASLSQNATTRVIVSNTNAGTSAIAGHTISNNSGASASINLYSSTYAAVPSFANRLLIGTDSGISNGILMRAPAGGFSVATDGSLSTANLLVNASGNTVLSGSLTAGASSTILKNQNAGTELLISNATGGTASFSGLSWGNNTSSSIMRLFASTYTGVSGWANRLVISQSASIANGILIRCPAGGIQLTADGSTNTANLLVDASGNTVLSGSLTTSQTAGIIGTTTNNDANTGSVGEYVESVVLDSAPVGISSATAANVTSISLTAGDWDVFGSVRITLSTGTTSSDRRGAINTTSATLPNSIYCWIDSSDITGIRAIVQSVPTRRISVSTTTTVYLVTYSVFAVSGASAAGYIAARRRR